MTKYVLGVDGGGTKTKVAIVNEKGEFISTGIGGTSNYDDVGPEVAQRNIQIAVEHAWVASGLDPRPFDAAFLGMPGVVSEKDYQIIRQIALNLDLASKQNIGIDHDCRVALAGGLSGRPGIVLIAGTGSSCYGMNANGDSWRAGGWGELIGDEGSSYRIGVQAMIAAVRAFDGRIQATTLQDKILSQLALGDMNEIMHHVYSKGMSRPEIAQLAPIVVDAAKSGDQIAQQILDQGVEDLVECVLAVAEKLKMDNENSEVVLIGGLMNATDVFVEPLKQALLKRLPKCEIKYPELSPELGACLLGLKILGGPVNNSIITALQQQ